MLKDSLLNDSEYQKMMVDGLNYSYSSWITSFVQRMGHKYVERKRRGLRRCLEIGCGTGEYLKQFGDGEYTGIDSSIDAILTARSRNPGREFVCGDIHNLPFGSTTFDCVISNYVFEHISELNTLMDEINRVLKADGRLLVCLPTEGGMAWDLGRRMTSKRYMEKKFNVDYMALIRKEHVNSCNDVLEVLEVKFDVLDKKYMPFLVPTVHLNAVVGLECRRR